MNSQKEVETIKMVSRALDVLEVLRTSVTSLGVNEISKLCEMSPSTAYRILKTLEQKGWAFQCNDVKYIIGEKISFVTEKNNLFLALKEIALFTMEKYTLEHGKAMNLTVRDGINCVILQQSRTKSIIDYVPPIGTKLPSYACAGGKILLSELPSPILYNLLESCEMIPFTQSTITDSNEFLKHINNVSIQGYAFDNHESCENGSCIAVAVRDKSNNIIAALSFSGFINIDDIEQLKKYIPILNQAAKEISDKLFECFNK